MQNPSSILSELVYPSLDCNHTLSKLKLYDEITNYFLVPVITKRQQHVREVVCFTAGKILNFTTNHF